ncbi:MAG: RecX family transcriptional regulator [Acidobacteria bacterium]|nr:RecX family transcriptional regulator [Acidobacteriota bacterium]
MATVTALRDLPRGRVAVELDGAPWRVLPALAVVRAGLAVGRALDRPGARALRRELRRLDAQEIAVRALRARDRSRAAVGRRLARASVAPDVRAETLELLARNGLVDDARFAVRRAEALAERGYGDIAIEADLEREQISAEERADALAALRPELERAEAVIARRWEGPRTARFLAGKGFGEDAVAAALGRDFASDG